MLLDKLKDYTASDVLPMHMPGHKRMVERFPWLAELGCGLDITEIDGFDNLNDPQGLFRDLELRAARLWGARESVCLVNGSTAGVLAAVRTALERGGELLLSRGCHKSVYHGAELTGAVTRYLTPEIDQDIGIWGPVTAKEVARKLEAYPNVRLVTVTSPTYEGVISDVAAIAQVCHSAGVPLLVDEAHGAHLGFGGFPDSAVRCGADLVVHSLHKTLPSLTQTAILHIGGDLIDPADVRRNTAIVQSSSPSYLLTASIDGCVSYLEREGEAAAGQWFAALRDFYGSLCDLKNLSLLHMRHRDPSKLVISTAGTDMTGRNLMALFRDRFRIELEMAAGQYVVAMTGMGDTAKTLTRFAEAIRAADAMCRKTGAEPVKKTFSLPEQKMIISKALTAKGGFRELKAAIGKISGEYVWAYPPGAPLLVPGERIDAAAIEALAAEENLRSTRRGLPKMIFCVDQ